MIFLKANVHCRQEIFSQLKDKCTSYTRVRNLHKQLGLFKFRNEAL